MTQRAPDRWAGLEAVCVATAESSLNKVVALPLDESDFANPALNCFVRDRYPCKHNGDLGCDDDENGAYTVMRQMPDRCPALTCSRRAPPRVRSRSCSGPPMPT